MGVQWGLSEDQPTPNPSAAWLIPLPVSSPLPCRIPQHSEAQTDKPKRITLPGFCPNGLTTLAMRLLGQTRETLHVLGGNRKLPCSEASERWTYHSTSHIAYHSDDLNQEKSLEKPGGGGWGRIPPPRFFPCRKNKGLEWEQKPGCRAHLPNLTEKNWI